MYYETKNINQAQKIINAAFKCISERGYANVSQRDIADEAGVVLSQLNYYYKNKEGLFAEVIKTLARHYLNEIEDNLKKGKTEKERMFILIEYFQEMLRIKPELFKILFDLTSMSLWSESLKKLQHDLFNDIAGLIRKYIIFESNIEKSKYNSSITLSKVMLGTLFGTSIQAMLDEEKEDMIESLSVLKVLFR